jgi:hypothetical protein
MPMAEKNVVWNRSPPRKSMSPLVTSSARRQTQLQQVNNESRKKDVYFSMDIASSPAFFTWLRLLPNFFGNQLLGDGSHVLFWLFFSVTDASKKFIMSFYAIFLRRSI